MKKLLITLWMVLTLSSIAWAGVPNNQLRSLVSSYKGRAGFEIVDIGGLGLRLLKGAARSAAETPEDREALKLFDGLKRLTIVDFSDAAAGDRDRFLSKARKILAGGEMLMEAKDGEEAVRIYGNTSADGSLLQDISILAGDALIFIRGSIQTDQVEALIKQAD